MTNQNKLDEKVQQILRKKIVRSSGNSIKKSNLKLNLSNDAATDSKTTQSTV